MIIGNYTFHILLERRRQLEVSEEKTAKRSKIKISSWSVFDLAFSDFGQKEIKDCKCFSFPSHFSLLCALTDIKIITVSERWFLYFFGISLNSVADLLLWSFFFESFVSHFLMDSFDLLGKIRSRLWEELGDSVAAKLSGAPIVVRITCYFRSYCSSQRL